MVIQLEFLNSSPVNRCLVSKGCMHGSVGTLECRVQSVRTGGKGWKTFSFLATSPLAPSIKERNVFMSGWGWGLSLFACCSFRSGLPCDLVALQVLPPSASISMRRTSAGLPTTRKICACSRAATFPIPGPPK